MIYAVGNGITVGPLRIAFRSSHLFRNDSCMRGESTQNTVANATPNRDSYYIEQA